MPRRPIDRRPPSRDPGAIVVLPPPRPCRVAAAAALFD